MRASAILDLACWIVRSRGFELHPFETKQEKLIYQQPALRHQHGTSEVPAHIHVINTFRVANIFQMSAVLLSTGHDKGIGKIKREDSLRFRTNLWPFRMSSRAELTKMNPALQRRQNDVMICAECFCAKGDTNTVRWSCQNPKCYFYFSASSRHAGSVGEIGGLPKTLANEPIFSREMSRDRRRDPPNSSSDILLSSLQKESVWGYHPETTHLQSQNSLCVEQKSRSLSISELHRYNPSKDKTRFLRTRIMSVPGPVCIESLDQDSDLIEDAFVSSPLPDFGEDSTSIGEEVSLIT